MREHTLKVLLLIVAAALSGCAGTTVYEGAVGAKVTQYMPWSRGHGGGFDGPNDTVRLSVRREDERGRTFCGLTHVSHMSAGWPFNNRDEDWLDIFECGVRFAPNR
jgi:hypothetical protein